MTPGGFGLLGMCLAPLSSVFLVLLSFIWCSGLIISHFPFLFPVQHLPVTALLFSVILPYNMVGH